MMKFQIICYSVYSFFLLRLICFFHFHYDNYCIKFYRFSSTNFWSLPHHKHFYCLFLCRYFFHLLQGLGFCYFPLCSLLRISDFLRFYLCPEFACSSTSRASLLCLLSSVVASLLFSVLFIVIVVSSPDNTHTHTFPLDCAVTRPSFHSRLFFDDVTFRVTDLFLATFWKYIWF